MNLLAPISTIMTHEIISLGPEDSLKSVENIFKAHKIHHIPVIDSDKLVGMVSKSDYLFFKRGFNDNSIDLKVDLFRLKTHKVRDIMIKKLAILEPGDKINIALEIFKENLFHAIPIVTEGKVVGMLTSYDIIKHLADSKGAINQYGKL